MTNLTAKLERYLSQDAVLASVFAYTKQRFDAAPHLTAHNFEHARRDMLNAIAIGEAEGANMHIVLCAAILHDIGFLYGATGRTHGKVGAEQLPEFLSEGNIQLPAAELTHIQDCLRTHKGSMHGHEPATLEAQVVADADLLEKLGPVGVYQSVRTFTEFNLDADSVVGRLKKKWIV
jgi:uncharacterized protein